MNYHYLTNVKKCTFSGDKVYSLISLIDAYNDKISINGRYWDDAWEFFAKHIENKSTILLSMLLY